MPKTKAKMGALKGGSFILIIALVLPLFVGGYLTGVNAWVGNQSKIQVTGKITNRFVKKSRRSTSHYLTVQHSSGQKTTLEVRNSTFEQYREGDHYSDTWWVGSLGYLYN